MSSQGAGLCGDVIPGGRGPLSVSVPVMAAGGAVLRLEAADLQCTVCMGYYSCPCTLPCGHTFCRGCIDKYWAELSHYNCPICQRIYRERPELNKNTDLAALLEALHAQEPRSHDNCPQCTGAGATKLCVPCMAPLCGEHQLLHRREPSTQRHLLLPLSTAGCRAHDRGVQYFCIAHSAPLCPACVLQHQHCHTEPLLELYRRNRERLEKQICELDEKITSKEETITNQRDAYREIQILICDMKDNLTQDFRDMRDYLEKQERASFWRMQKVQEMAQKATMQEIQLLMADMERLRKVKVELQERIDNDCMAVLKDSGEGIGVQALSPNKRYTLDENRLVDTTDFISKMKKSLLSQPLLEHVPCPPKQVFEDALVLHVPPGPDMHVTSTNLPERSPNRLLQWAAHISFDLETLSSRLAVSEDLKTVTVTSKNNVYVKSGRRFTTSQVLALPAFTSECSYWELSTNDSDGWGVGAADAQMGRDGKLGRNEFSWCVEWNKGQLTAWHNNEEVPIHLPRPLNVGVLLNCPEKKVQFYSISEDQPTLIHSYTFHVQGPIYPAVWLYGLRSGNTLTIRDIQRISV